MYALIYKSGSFLGFFSSKKHMRIVIEALIRDNYEDDGYHGDYHFRYAKIKLNEPWFAPKGKDDANMDEGKSILSLSTMHTEYFKHKVKTDWSTGKIISMDADKTNNLD